MISYVPQRPAAHLTFAVEQIIAMGRYARDHVPQTVESAIELCDLQDVRHRVFGQLSVGQQQRVALARAIAQSFDAEPSRHAIILDEPVSSMDLKHVHQTMARLKELACRGYAIAVVLHDLNLTARYADDVWLLNQGCLVQRGEWHQVLVPSVLEPVYDVKLSTSSEISTGRPVFHIAQQATLLKSIH